MATINSVQNLEGILKERYTGVMYDTTVRYSDVLSMFQQGTGEVYDGPDGKFYKFSDLTGGLQGIGARLQGEWLPEGGTPLTLNPIMQLKYLYCRVQTTYQSMIKAAQGPSAFASFADAVLVPAVKNFTDDLDRQACSTSSGALARVDMASPTTSLDIDAPFGIAADIKGWLTLKRGMTIVLGPNLDGTGLRDGGTSVTVLNVNKNGNSGGGTLTLSALPAGTADNDYLFRGDPQGNNTADTGVPRECMGLAGIVDNGTLVPVFEGIDRTTVSDWNAQYINAANAPYSGNFTEGLAMRAITDARLKGGGKVNMLVTSDDCWRQAYNALRQLGGYGATRDGQTTPAGSRGIPVQLPSGPVELKGVPRLPVGTLYALDTSTLCRFKYGEGMWDDTPGGSMWTRVQVGGSVKDEYFAFYRFPTELGCKNPQANLFANGIDETAY